MKNINLFPYIITTILSFIIVLIPNVSPLNAFLMVLNPCTAFITFYCIYKYKFYRIDSQNGMYINQLSLQTAISLTFYSIYFFVFALGLVVLTGYIANLFQMEDITNTSAFYSANMLFSSTIYLFSINILNNVISRNTPQESNSEMREADSV